MSLGSLGKQVGAANRRYLIMQPKELEEQRSHCEVRNHDFRNAMDAKEQEASQMVQDLLEKSSTIKTIGRPYTEIKEFARNGKPKSPFKSLDTEIYLYRDIECTEKERIRAAQQNLKVHEKSTISSRARSRKALKKLEEAIERETKGEIEKEVPALNWALAFAKCCQSDKQSIADYISEQKELFLLEFAVKTKQLTMSNLEEMTAKEEKRAKIAETKLEEDTIAFEEFLKENDRSSVDALKMAAQEAKSKMEVTAEMKSAMNELFSLRSEIANTEDLLKLYFSYETFLLSVSPKEWQEQEMAKMKKLKKEKKGLSKSFISFPACDKSKLRSTSFILRHRINKWAHLKGQHPGKKMLPARSTSVVFAQSAERKSLRSQGSDYRFFKRPSRITLAKRLSMEGKRKSLVSCPSEKSISSEEDVSLNDINSDEEPEIYFKDPDELLQMYRHLEEQNLSLFQNIQDISGTLEDRRQREHIVVQQMEQRIKDLVNEKKALTAACIKEEQKSAELALKAKVFSLGEYNPVLTDKTLKTLNKKIAEVYRACCGTIEVSSMTSFQMLKAIEIRVSELCEMFETLPPEYLEVIEATEKLRAKERRQRVREDKLKELKRIQEERLKHALERAIAAPKKRVGRKLVYRSEPPEIKTGKENVVDLTTKSEDDYYFN
ncbi:coiled-coil domain-containing protein 38 [Rhineura floridana]|uniref:coiled-coil domain-containing protein 38 n=1 Tax=Rhineura floridana TaxID=261503 RepID=UPI002AC879AE|nr:coiled-coil domain-containing protein 38 [Rhineura floridana]